MKLKVIDSVSSSGPGRPNEDAWGALPCAAWVIDGATSLGVRPETSATCSGGRALARAVSHALEQEADSESDLVDVVRRALSSAQENVGQNPAAGSAWDASAAAAIILLRGSALEFLLFGDCGVAVSDADEPFIADDRLSQLDDRAIRHLTTALQSGLNVAAARQATLPMLQAHRAMLNQPGGYPALTLDGQGLAGALQLRRSAIPGMRMLLCSDGFSDAVTRFELASWSQLLSGEYGLERLVHELRRAEDDDESLSRFPRLKKSDDSTAVLLEVIR